MPTTDLDAKDKANCARFKAQPAEHLAAFEQFLVETGCTNQKNRRFMAGIAMLEIEWGKAADLVDWIAQQRQKRATEAANKAAQAAERQQAAQEHTARLEAAVAAAIEHGELIPEDLRTRGRSVCCSRVLTDAHSIRLGIGPECRTRAAKKLQARFASPE